MDAVMINGKPARWISVGAAEKINTGNFSNVDVGPVVTGRWVEDLGTDELPKQIKEEQDVVEEYVAAERQAILVALGLRPES
jgi:hypothetical protein